MDLVSHGSPRDRGRADRYYGRGRYPHWCPNGTGYPPTVYENEMTPEQIAEYNKGYNEEDDRKDWGVYA